MASALGLTAENFDSRQFVLDSLEYKLNMDSFDDDEKVLRERPDEFASLYLSHFQNAMGRTLAAQFPGLKVEGIVIAYGTGSYPLVIQECSVAIGVETMQGIYQSAKEIRSAKEKIRREQETYQPKSPLLSIEGLQAITAGELATAELFSYPSVEDGGTESRVAHNEQSQSAQRYGAELQRLLSMQGSEKIADFVRGAGSKVEQLLGAVDITPSAWTEDGAWAVWDIAKANYYAYHFEEQAKSERPGFFIDFIHYRPLSMEDGDRNISVNRLAYRQVGWELTRNLSSGVATEVLAHLKAATDSREYTEIAGKLAALVDGGSAHLKSSELSELGGIVEELVRRRSAA